MSTKRTIFHAAPGFFVVGLLLVPPAFAQGVLIAPTRQYNGYQSYQTPLYTPPTPSSLDKNYGMPAFGMPGAELPRQRTLAPRDQNATRPGAPAAGAQTANGQAAAPAGQDPDPMMPGPQTPDGQDPAARAAAPQPTGVPDFFANPPDFVLTRPAAPRTDTPSAAPDTPMFSTAEGTTTDDAQPSIFAQPRASVAAGGTPNPDGMDTPLFTTNDATTQ